MVQTLQGRLHQELISPPCCPPYRAPHPGPTRPPSAWTNPNIDLLRAMRPLLSPRRARKVDDAIRIMQLIQLLPALKESGLFALGGDSQ